MFFAVAELIEVFYRLLFEFARVLSLFLLIFNVLGSCLLSKHHIIPVRLEHHVEVALEIEPSFLGRHVHLGKHVRIKVLEDVFVASEVLLQQAKVLLALIDEVGNNFEHT